MYGRTGLENTEAWGLKACALAQVKYVAWEYGRLKKYQSHLIGEDELAALKQGERKGSDDGTTRYSSYWKGLLQEDDGKDGWQWKLSFSDTRRFEQMSEDPLWLGDEERRVGAKELYDAKEALGKFWDNEKHKKVRKKAAVKEALEAAYAAKGTDGDTTAQKALRDQDWDRISKEWAEHNDCAESRHGWDFSKTSKENPLAEPLSQAGL